jgi:hypothetical protein
MGTTPPLALSNLVSISVTVEPGGVAAPQFNQGLFVGPSTVIPSYGSNPRLRQYASTTAMLSDGFTSSDPEFIAAQIYFSQNPAPQFIWIGRQDLTAIQTAVPDGRTVTDGAITATQDVLTSATANFVSGDVGSAVRVVGAGAAGVDLVTTIASVTNSTTAVLAANASTTVTGAQTSIGAVGAAYKVGDIVGVTQGGASNGFLTVLTIGTSGVVKTLGTVVGTQGTGYTVANGLSTTGGSGTGLEVNITAVGETLLQAAEACREASTVWYGLVVNNPADSDNLALAEWADPMWQTTRYYPWSSDIQIANAVANNVALQLQALQLRVLGTYATTQNGAYANNIYAAAAVMGVEMGLNTGLANSFFTAAHKQLEGIAPEPLSQTQYTNIKAAGFNVYANLSPFQDYEPGLMSNGAPSYLWLFLAMLCAQIQYNEIAELNSNPAIAQTNADEHLLIQAAEQACQNLANIGFIAGGTWQGTSFSIVGVSIQNGEALNLGYSVQAQVYSQQSSGDRAAGKAMPLYVFIITAGAVLSIAIGVYVQL